MDQTKKPDQGEQERAAAAVQAPAVAVGELLDEAGQRAREALEEVAAKALPSPKGRLHSHEAERGVLCAILLDSEQYEEAVLQGLMAQDFHHPAHAMIFEAMVQLYQAHQPIDVVTLTQRLTDQGKLDAVGGQGVLLQLESLLATTAHAPAYVKLVQDKAILRKLVRAASDIVRWSFRPDKEAVLVIDQAEQAILSVRRETASKGIVPIHDLAVQALLHYEKLHKKEAMVAGIPSGFADLDRLTCGFQKGELTIIAARPSMGKTAFTLNIASHVAMRKQVPVAFFSLEMSAEQLMHRLMGSEARLGFGVVGPWPGAAWG
ncbi:MAG: DnaB-like helicase C-terminal domain-containing protein [Myxococcota bacterium]